MSSFILISGLVAAAGLFVTLYQRGSLRQACALPSLSGGVLGLIGFCFLPWVRVNGMVDTTLHQATERLAELAATFDSPELISTTQTFIHTMTSTSITGWWLVVVAPVFSIKLRVILMLVLTAYLVSLSGAASTLSNHVAARAIIIAQIALSIAALVSLFIAIFLISLVDIKLGILWFLLRVAGLGIGGGVWWCFIGLILCITGGVLHLVSRAKFF